MLLFWSEAAALGARKSGEEVEKQDAQLNVSGLLLVFSNTCSLTAKRTISSQADKQTTIPLTLHIKKYILPEQEHLKFLTVT